MLLCPLAGRLAASPAWLRALLLLLDSSRNLAPISLLGAYLGRLAGSQAYGAVAKYSASRAAAAVPRPAGSRERSVARRRNAWLGMQPAKQIVSICKLHDEDKSME